MIYSFFFLRYATGFMIPPKDDKQNIEPLHGSFDGMWLSFTFKRKRITSDTSGQDYQFRDGSCPHVLLASGGSYDGATDKPLNMHTRRFASTSKMCIHTCK